MAKPSDIFTISPEDFDGAPPLHGRRVADEKAKCRCVTMGFIEENGGKISEIQWLI
jgi:hypothetical protein